jgi:hypothetical protein
LHHNAAGYNTHKDLIYFGFPSDNNCDRVYKTLWSKKMINPTDTAMSIAHALIFFSTIGCIVFVLINWNKQDSNNPVKVEKD